MTNEKIYNLGVRTALFSKMLVKAIKRVPLSFYNKDILNQLQRSGLSIGANYREADNAASSKDFVNKLNICKKESAETLYWLDILMYSEQKLSSDFALLRVEVNELNLIFNSIVIKVRNKTKP